VNETTLPEPRTCRQAPQRIEPKVPRLVPPRRLWLDGAIVLLLVSAAAPAAFFASRTLDPVILGWPAVDVWFEGDVGRVYANMTSRGSNHYRSSVHPIFSLTAYGLVMATRKVTGSDPETAVRLVMASAAAVWIAAVYLVLRLITLRRLDAAVFTMLAASSAFAIFWHTVPETYAFGSIGILGALLVAAASGRMRLGVLSFAGGVVSSLAFTITNGMAGLAAALVCLRPRRAAAAVCIGTLVVAALAIYQSHYFPRSGLLPDRAEEAKFILHPEAGGPLLVARSFFYHSVFMPEFEASDRKGNPDWPILVTQRAAAGSGSLWGTMGIAAWTVLLGFGALAALRSSVDRRFRIVLAALIAGQLALHVLYGEETFLYSCHFGPLLVILAALGALTRARSAVLCGAGLVTVLAMVNNAQGFTRAAEFLRHHGTPRHRVLSAMADRPSDPWPSGDGHVILGLPGSPLEDKAYHEPGGCFSPAPGAFGVSVWVAGSDGSLLSTSERPRGAAPRQRLAWGDPLGLPSVITETDDYAAEWSRSEGGGSRLRLDVRGEGTAMLAIRSVGPAGGGVSSIDWNGARLLIDGEWKITVDPAPVEVHCGEEGIRGWAMARTGLHRWEGQGGWGFARLVLPSRKAVALIERERGPKPQAGIPFVTTRALVQVDVPDETFEACLDAQTAHLLMSLVGRETRSSDPVNVPVPWQRTGAYIISALAAAGHLDAAKELSLFLAENDFYGGFGAEGDAPGLGLWALEEVASRLSSPEYDRTIWPHVRRKAEWILKLASAGEPIRARVTNDIVPRWHDHPDIDLVAEPAKDGLLQGRMDFHRPALYVTAVSQGGLRAAAAMAGRLGFAEEARRWRARADELKAAWRRAYPSEARQNERTYATGIWPTWTAAPAFDAFREGLDRRWSLLRDDTGGFRERPLWTYFEVAAAHQDLFLGRADRTWQTLRWFWANQASPGLFTWWEDRNEGNAFGGWERIRGWVAPGSSQPHYWTSAEILLLQLDMLAHVDASGDEPAIVIGAGVPEAWLDSALSVRGLPTTAGMVDWTWKEGLLKVSVEGRKCIVRQGKAFPGGTRLVVQFSSSRSR